MITMHQVSRFIVDTLDTSIEFKNFVQETIGNEMTYLIYRDMEDLLKTAFPPNYASVATYENIDETGIEFSFKTVLLVTIQRYASITVGSVQEEPSFEKLELISLKAKEILKHEMSIFGINQDKNIKITVFNMFTPAPMGEEGLQMEINIEMSKDLDVCSTN